MVSEEEYQRLLNPVTCDSQPDVQHDPKGGKRLEAKLLNETVRSSRMCEFLFFEEAAEARSGIDQHVVNGISGGVRMVMI